MYSNHARVVVPIKEDIDLKTNATGCYTRAQILSDNQLNNKSFTGNIIAAIAQTLANFCFTANSLNTCIFLA